MHQPGAADLHPECQQQLRAAGPRRIRAVLRELRGLAGRNLRFRGPAVRVRSADERIGSSTAGGRRGGIEIPLDGRADTGRNGRRVFDAEQVGHGSPEHSRHVPAGQVRRCHGGRSMYSVVVGTGSYYPSGSKDQTNQQILGVKSRGGGLLFGIGRRHQQRHPVQFQRAGQPRRPDRQRLVPMARLDVRPDLSQPGSISRPADTTTTR